MLYVFFGPPCSGKSSIAESLKSRIDAEIWTGKDYLRLAKNEQIARKKFITLMAKASSNPSFKNDSLIFVLSDSPEQFPELETLEHKRLIGFSAELNVLKTRFSVRTSGHLPDPVAKMLEKSKQKLDSIECDLRVDTSDSNPTEFVDKILAV
jgi:chloramphenicol 3-O-phosphotransferase